ncbi:Fcf2p KNAG_0L00350 [Huiozyma naganishii CBS 8797]|uniref:Fcf2 pre-rRNA processing C-terminal domain-containing protein n=1 Tax=Huiozyma naganishii (strain ATCC MYA-139 / BCRC 22969 / CBS 8797 / KCTC 17520 / NBRC 10181 / NCYC 3082 / Yp74L-3) TaxID=1071383 RepID=J7RRZ6_HUIN7|nr:hypothetical protein KNAG_0L00350 [Kazachstania naganishii CBS 8797]CCK72658.1 hypothetical protein KNAG_0L00350 [Kazachstania naganishii CBS 8797]
MSDGDQQLEDLFASLREVSKGADREEKSGESAEQDDNVLQLDHDKRDTERIFRDIEVGLKKLPKLDTGFDLLVTGCPEKVRPDGLLEDGTNVPTKRSVSDDWFTLPKPSDDKRRELQRDLLLIKHRAALDPKRHYKKDRWVVPDRFSVGTIVEDKTEFYSSRLTNKQRKPTILETMMADDASNKYFKRKYAEIQQQKMSGRRGHFKKTKDARRRF